VQNIVLKKEVGYFDTAAELKPLLHLWSLAIEEQFYVIYPVLIFAAWRRGRNLLAVILLLGLISFGLNIHGIGKSPTKTFFMPQTRFWELLAGASLAYLQFFRKTEFFSWIQSRIFHPTLFHHSTKTIQQRELFNSILSVIGLFLILMAIFFTNKSKSFPGWWALLPVSGATLLIFAGPQAVVNRAFLASRLMVFVGVISYPLYLWHWPILSFIRIVESETPSLKTQTTGLILSFVLAWLTYHVIEKPIRFGRKTWIKTATLSLVLAVIGYIGYDTFQRNGLEFRTKPFLKVIKAAGEWEYPGKLVVVNREKTLDYYIQQSEIKSMTLFIGDSNIEQYYPRVEALITRNPKETNGIIFKTGGGCLAIPDQSQDIEHMHCSTLMQGGLRIAEENPEIDTVVIGSLWNQYLGHGASMTKKYGIDSKEYVDALEKLSEYIKKLQALDKKVFLVLNIPMGKQLDPKYMVQRDLNSFPNVLSIRTSKISRDEFERAYGRIQTDLAHVAINAGAAVINPIDSLCLPDCLSVDAKNEPIYKDAGHLRPTYVREKADFIDVTVRRSESSSSRQKNHTAP